MTTTEIERDVPSNKVDNKIALNKASGAKSIEKILQPDGNFTIIAIFDDPSSKKEPTSTRKQLSLPTVESTGSTTNSKTGDDSISSSSTAEELVLHQKIKAMLEVLAFTEGTGNDYGKIVEGTVISSPLHPELVGKKNVSVTDLSQHPNILVQVNANLKSSAAGRYQFLKKTWDKLEMPDFQPKSQDIAAVKLMKKRKMIQPLLSGDLHSAVFRGSQEWASLPTQSGGSFFGGQPARTLSEIETKYKSSLA
ncbi:hypothetical protein MGMO_93c00070 [Methyloglobulus morosus KoM1]|uniref:Lysozyme n=1 Tax=Methyloglobulus morosus KoM1 TaxID=1116472 RepID=V5BUW2_9GAMM|nr:glycoside hydrolase family 104 protein [Methyloglobulus morosus]ESS71649.1 hypothetical protein MGMO_93c00070 [Methyloglobulus morosus KoM1]